MKKTILTILVCVGLLGAGYYFWMHRYEYFFQGEEPYELNEEDEKEDGFENDDFQESLGDEGGWEELEKEDDNDEDDNDVSYDSPTVTKGDCDNSCSDFDNEEDKEYCMEICGLAEEKETIDSCEELEAVKKDACFKQKAIDNKDQSYCDKIVDEDLQENCRNRVIEELLD